MYMWEFDISVHLDVNLQILMFCPIRKSIVNILLYSVFTPQQQPRNCQKLQSKMLQTDSNGNVT